MKKFCLWNIVSYDTNVSKLLINLNRNKFEGNNDDNTYDEIWNDNIVLATTTAFEENISVAN